MFWLQLAVVVAAIFLGVRTGGVGLGIWGLVGLFVLVFGLGAELGSAPADVVFIILCAITAASVMEAAGGIDWMVHQAARVIRRWPRSIVFLAPLIAFLFTVGAGTGNLYYALLPVIYDVSYAEGIRPERPLAIATVASQAAITCSPVSAATAALTVLLAAEGFTLPQILMITIPSTLMGLLAGSVLMMRWGRELGADPDAQSRIAVEGSAVADVSGDGPVPPTGKRAALIFIAGVALIVVLGIFDDLRPVIGEGSDAYRVGVPQTIMMVMSLAAAAIILACGVKGNQVPRQSVFAPGIVAAVALFGLAWAASAFIDTNLSSIVDVMSDVVSAVPWSFAVAVAIVAMLTTSQAATVAAMVPIGLTVGLEPAAIAAMVTATAGCMILPTQGGQLAAVEFDRTGTTRIGRFVVNHSFQLPTLLFIAVSVPIGLLLAGASGSL